MLLIIGLLQTQRLLDRFQDNCQESSNVESDRYLEDASYIRFRNLNIGYKFTKKTYNGLPVDEIKFTLKCKTYSLGPSLMVTQRWVSVVQRVKLIC
jgi:hypothetical protein